MLTPFLLHLLTYQSDPEAILKAHKIGATETVVAVNGQARLPGGIVVQLIGACELSAKPLKPWGWDGKPLNAGMARWFWYGVDIDPREELDLYGAAKTLAVAFRHTDKVHVGPPIHGRTDYGLGSEHYKPAKPANDFPMATIGFKYREPAEPMNIELEVEPFNGVDLMSIDPSSKTWPAGFNFEFRSQKVGAFKATQKKTEEYEMRSYGVAATVPEHWKNIKLELRASDYSLKKGDFDSAMARSEGIPGELVEPSLKGKIVFMISAKERPKYKRTFILSAKPSYRVEFKDIPISAK